ncbi:hypothetical protein LOD99_280 [Oopsacas minuta]|uniref:RRM domain-containing protein n=1 Tax=Oopsacas minuta TaxID=111878 RepID=A0AAV7KB55_9METZ|nr:hypothetical protein LOD99_280 [Oopsacas minuta]
MFNYRTNPQGIRPIGGSYFRTPPGQRAQRQSFNRPINTSNRPISKPMGSKPQITITSSTASVVKQSDTQKPNTQESESVIKRPAVEQQPNSDNKLESIKTKDTPVVQQSLYESIPGISPQPPNQPPLSEPPPPLPTTAQSSSVISTTEASDTKKDEKSEDKEEISWSPPPPEPQQKPLSIPLSADTQIPFGATLTQKNSYSERIQSAAKDTPPVPTIQEDTPFQSQFIKGYQPKKVPVKTDTPPQPTKEAKPAPHQNTGQGYSDNNQYQQGQQPQQPQQSTGNPQYGRKRPLPPTGKWQKGGGYTRPAPAPSPMQTEYELDPKVDRSILEAEPKEIIKKFTNRCRLFVGGIVNADEKLLKDMFIKFGAISELWLNKDKGFGFVKMDTRANAQRAIDHYNGLERLNTMIRVRFAARSSAIKISNLSFAVTNELLEDSFKTFGEVEHAIVACDERGKSLGWGVVDFAMKKSAIHAIARCKEGMFILCRSPIPVMVTELKDEDLEEGVVEKTVFRNVLYQREREEGPRFAMPGTMEYQMGLKWKGFLEKARAARESLEENLKSDRVKLEDETESEMIHYLEQQDMLRHQEELRKQDEMRRSDEAKKQESMRYHEMIKQETRRRSQSMRIQDDLKRREESLQRGGEFGGGNEDRGYTRHFGQSRPTESSYGYPSQDYEHGYNTKPQQDWGQSTGSSHQKEWVTESDTSYGNSGYQGNQGRSTQSCYDDYSGYSSQYDQGQSVNQYGGDSYNKDQYSSGDQYRGDNRGYTSNSNAQSRDEYRNYGNNPTGASSSGNYSSDGYGTGYGASSSQAQSGSGDWNYGQGGQSNIYEGGYGDQYGDNQPGGGGGSYDRRRPHSGDMSAGRMGYPGSEKRRKF